MSEISDAKLTECAASNYGATTASIAEVQAMARELLAGRVKLAEAHKATTFIRSRIYTLDLCCDELVGTLKSPVPGQQVSYAPSTALSQAMAGQEGKTAGEKWAEDQIKDGHEEGELSIGIWRAIPSTLPRCRKVISEAIDKNRATARAESERDIAAARDLLAVMHRDGGHHTEKVGFVQSCKDAVDERHRLIRRADELMAAREQSEKALADLKEKYGALERFGAAQAMRIKAQDSVIDEADAAARKEGGADAKELAKKIVCRMFNDDASAISAFSSHGDQCNLYSRLQFVTYLTRCLEQLLLPSAAPDAERIADGLTRHGWIIPDGRKQLVTRLQSLLSPDSAKAGTGGEKT